MSQVIPGTWKVHGISNMGTVSAAVTAYLAIHDFKPDLSSASCHNLCPTGMHGSAGKCQVHGVDNVGTVPAAVTAYLAVHEFHPDLVISIGTAGGFKAKGAAIGDVFLATAFANHDRRIPIPVSRSMRFWIVNVQSNPLCVLTLLRHCILP